MDGAVVYSLYERYVQALTISYSKEQRGSAQKKETLRKNGSMSVLVLGLGESGVAITTWFSHLFSLASTFTKREAGHIFVFDTRENPPGLDQIKEQINQKKVQRLNELTINSLPWEAFDLVVVSPGLSLEQGEIADALARVRQQFPSLCIWGELDVFAIALAGLKQFYNYGPKVIGITGSNGKTTVTAFTAHMTRALGYSSVVAGNISPALLTVLLEQLERESPSNWPQVWVLELSSFQLAGWAGVVDCYDWQLDASVVLNISEDHLDWHGSMGTYQNAKIKLLQHSQCVVLNHDEPLLSDAIHKRGLGKDFIFFGLNIPTKNPSVLRWSLHDQQIGFYEEGRFVPVILATNLKIRGLHNVSNTLAVLSLCEAAGLLDSLSISVKRLDQSILEKLQRGLISYQGEPHRVEWVGQVEGIDFFDDSKGTNVGATQAALKGLSGQGFDVFVILGGEGKGQNFLPLAQDVVRYTKGVALIGRDAPLIEEAIVQADVDGFICCQVVGELTGAVDLLFKWAKEQKRLLLANTSAQKPQIQIAVLLSPACASFDQFRGYAHRAEVFVQKVKSLC